MVSFLEEVITALGHKKIDITKSIYVLPSKRAGIFLKKIISQKCGKTIIAPKIYSIEEFIEKISGISYASQTQQLFELYKAYLTAGSYAKESLDSFLTWGQTLLQDIIEIDRYLIDAQSLFTGLSAIQEVNHWSVQQAKTSLMENYLHFWRQLPQIYAEFNSNLLAQDLGHQGLVYRKAAGNISRYIANCETTHIFMGFNALNLAESKIIQTLLSQTDSHIFWDIDRYFLEDKLHDAGLFLRNHQKSWKHFTSHTIEGVSDLYLIPKHIEIIGVPKNTAQTKYVGGLLEELQRQNSEGIKNTAVILGDESLLNPLLNSIPDSISAVNITMGQKLELTGAATFFSAFMDLHLNQTKKGWFYKDFVGFLNNPFTIRLMQENGMYVAELTQKINSKNWIYITQKEIEELLQESSLIISQLFFTYEIPLTFISKCDNLVMILKGIFQDKSDFLLLEQLYKLNSLFNQIRDIIKKYNYLHSLKGLKSLYDQLLASETLDFKGDPLEGLQIMGMLESRNLDFETIILTSVNEGILPSGKSNNSFIPFDLKQEFGLPTYKEKDAVYTYHFYRLLQRAKKVFLLYNTEPDVLEGGEKSRLLTQILTDENRSDVLEKIAAPHIWPVEKKLKRVVKTEGLEELLTAYALKGFSPSSLSNYIRNPVDFYKQHILGIEDSEWVEEDIAANTMGTIIHDSLEELYTPFLGKELDMKSLKDAKLRIEEVVGRNFMKTYSDSAYNSGKNLIAFHVTIKYIQKFIDSEMEQLSHHTVKILALERKLNLEIHLPNPDKKVVLKGKLDRIDEIDGLTRIIDYKTGKVEKRNLEIMDWQNITNSYDYSKAFQLLCYSYMYLKTRPTANIQAGIISIKNPKSGVMLFQRKTSARDTNKNPTINSELIQEFEPYLFALIEEILNPDKPFVEKDI